ncbi:uncharacterized protein [Centruroides vittatus]|uniref:uncharacterized protein n=1 Tax=Centruroides vittatus TaxID=120091 RepID=UPI003510D063
MNCKENILDFGTLDSGALDWNTSYSRYFNPCNVWRDNVGVIIDFEAFTIDGMDLPFNTLCRQLGFVAQNSNEYQKIEFYNEIITFKDLSFANKKNVRFGNYLHGLYLAYEKQYFGNWEKSDNVCKILYNLFLKYKFFYYKGGEIEKNYLNLTSEIYNVNIPYFDLEERGVPKSSKIRVPCPYHTKIYPHYCHAPKNWNIERPCPHHHEIYPHICMPPNALFYGKICPFHTRFTQHCSLCDVFSYKAFMIEQGFWQ